MMGIYMVSHKISSFTPVKWDDNKHKFAEACDQYFSYLGGRTVKVIKEDPLNKKFVCETTKKSSWLTKLGYGLLALLKIASLVTIVVPLIFAIGKAYYRSGKEFIIEDQPLRGRVTSGLLEVDDIPSSESDGEEHLPLGGLSHRIPQSTKIFASSDSDVQESDSEDQESVNYSSGYGTPSGPKFNPDDFGSITIVSNPEDEDDFLIDHSSTSILTDTAGASNGLDDASEVNPTAGILTATYLEGTTEQIRTLNSVERTKQILTQEVASLEQQLSQTTDTNRREILLRKIERCTLMQEACAGYDGFDKPANVKIGDFDQWFGSYYWRALITDHFNKLPEKCTPDNYLSAYKNAVAEFIAAPVNFRKQTITCGNEELSFLRCGALYDPTNPYTHLNELKAIREEGASAIAKKCKQIEKLRDGKKGWFPKLGADKTNPYVTATTNFALDQLSNIDETIRIREENLKRQGLQIVWAQIEIAQAKNIPFPDGELKMAHIGLLNEDNISMDNKSGWYHHEGNEIQDMAAVYQYLNNKTIVFDVSGGAAPFIDANDVIHMPAAKDQSSAQVTLKAAYFNISVQGKLENKGRLQRRINEESSKDIGFIFPKRKKNTCKSSVEHATLLQSQLQIAGFQTAVSCLSGKDRTGWVAYQAVLDFIEKKGVARPTGANTPGYEILNDVLEQNYGKRVIKLTKRWMNGFNPGDRGDLLMEQLDDLRSPPAKLRGRNGFNLTLSDEEYNVDDFEGLQGTSSISSGSEDDSSSGEGAASSIG